MFELLHQLDSNALLWIQNHLRSEMGNQFFTWFTSLGNAGMLWIVVTILLLIYPKTRKTGFYCMVALILDAVIVNLIMKPLANRTRPYEVIRHLRILVPYQADASFPSGHTAAAFAVTGVLLWRGPAWVSVPAVIVACALGFSRLYVGVHYPTDVVSGALIGLLCGLATCYYFEVVRKKKMGNR